MKQVIKLNEQDFQKIVEECTRQIINEEFDEGLIGGAKATGQRLWNKLTGNKDYKKTDDGEQIQNTQGNFFNRLGGKIDKFGNSVENARKTYQVGSANQDAQKAIKNATTALKNLLDASRRMKEYGGGGLQGKQLQAIQAAYEALTSGQGATTIGGGFQGSANAVSGGGTLRDW